MIVNKNIACNDFSCSDVNHKCYMVPDIDINPENVSIVLISECAPENSSDYYYSGQDSLFQKTTVQAFNDAGVKVKNTKELIDLGVYLTTAIKCGKTDYVIKANNSFLGRPAPPSQGRKSYLDMRKRSE